MLELFVTFFKLGLFTIGGGVAMIPILSNIMVKDKKWFTEDEMIDIIAICQGLPGVIAINMATYVGFKKRGLIGSFVATFGVILPSFGIIVIIAKGMNFIDGNPYVQGALGGLVSGCQGCYQGCFQCYRCRTQFYTYCSSQDKCGVYYRAIPGSRHRTCFTNEVIGRH